MFILLNKCGNIYEYVFINRKDSKEVSASAKRLFYLICPLAKSTAKSSDLCLNSGFGLCYDFN